MVLGLTRFLSASIVTLLTACGGRIEGAGTGEGASGQGGGSGSAGANAGGAAGAGGFKSTGGVKGTGGTVSGSGGDLIGSCNPAFCASSSVVKGCCMGPNGPCGHDFGAGCTQAQCQYDVDCPMPPVPCQPCADGSCASTVTYCQSGMCVTSMIACPAPPPVQIPFWQQGCVPPICRDAGATMPLCDPGYKEFAGNPCSSPGKLCAVTYGCTDVLLCWPQGCPTPL